MKLKTKKFKFDAAHRLPDYDGPCKNLHGHTWTLELFVIGRPQHNGMVIDFKTLHKQATNVIKSLDHSYLNDKFDNPTCECIATYILQKISKILKEHSNIHTIGAVLQEGTGGSVSCTYTGTGIQFQVSS